MYSIDFYKGCMGEDKGAEREKGEREKEHPTLVLLTGNQICNPLVHGPTFNH